MIHCLDILLTSCKVIFNESLRSILEIEVEYLGISVNICARVVYSTTRKPHCYEKRATRPSQDCAADVGFLRCSVC
jgi:hypothetical protein